MSDEVNSETSLNPEGCLTDLTDDNERTREQLFHELKTLRQQLAQLKRSKEQDILDRLAHLFRTSPDIIAITAWRNGQYVDVNDGFIDHFGYSRAEVIGRTPAELGIWVNAAERDRCRARLQTEGVFYNSEFEFRVKSGDITTLLLSAELHRFNGDAYILTVCKDITDRKRAESALQQAIEREQQARERERLIATIAQNIRQSLELEQMLNTTVVEVRRFLQVDRAVIYQFQPNWDGTIIAESVRDPSFSILHQQIHDPCFETSVMQLYRQGRIHAVNDILAANLETCYIELLTHLQVRAILALPILVQDKLWGLLIAHECAAPRHWQTLNQQLLQQLSTQLAIGIHQANLYRQTQQQAQQEHGLNQVIQAIRNSLDLDTIFSTAASHVNQLLQVDRTEIVQYFPERRLWVNVADYRRKPTLVSALDVEIPDENNAIAAQIKQLATVKIDDSSTLIEDPVNSSFAQTYPGAWLLIPIQVNSSVWGALSVIRDGRYVWQSWEEQILRTIADQLAIAIYQSQLYQQVQQLNSHLEEQVQERTAQLQQALNFESLLNRITDKMRDSLDETQILQTTVEELALCLGVYRCDTGLYDLEHGTSTIRYEFVVQEGMPHSQGAVLSMADYPDIYKQLLKRDSFQCCIPVCPSTESDAAFSILACPIMDEQGVIGDMWLYRAATAGFAEDEIRLVQQVSNQCAIALRQSRLYQASQTQVQELARLNYLKDDFLSTISHELRTPMSNIKMAAQMLEIQLKNLGVLDTAPPSARRYLHILTEECQREITLINNLLDLSHLEIEPDPLILRTIDPVVWIRHIIEPFERQIQESELQLHLQIPEHLPDLTTDLNCLENILTELLTNACKYTPSGEQICLSVMTIAAPSTSTDDAAPTPSLAYGSDGDWLRIQITNTGVEIPAGEYDRIFDKFYRIPNPDPWKHSGVGIGLALAKKRVQHLRGSIQVASQAGQTTFTVQLPMQ